MALTKSGFKDQNWSHLEGGTNREERRKRKKRRGKRREAKIKPTRYGNYFEYGFCMDHMEFKA